jgi:glutaminase
MAAAAAAAVAAAAVQATQQWDKVQGRRGSLLARSLSAADSICGDIMVVCSCWAAQCTLQANLQGLQVAGVVVAERHVRI